MKRPSPSELRKTLGENLRALSAKTGSISGLCRELGINRTQFNRYLAGESFPRPDVLFRICQYFNVDARIILEPLSEITVNRHSLLDHPEIADFLSGGVSRLSEQIFPSGFFKFVRRSFLDEDRFVQGLVFVYRKDNITFLRGYEPRSGMVQQGLPSDPSNREFRGALLAQEGGIAGLASHRNSLTMSFNFLAQVPSFQNNYWVGYTVRTVRESPTGSRVARLVYEHLGQDWTRIMATARSSGFCTADDLVPYERRQLRIDEPFF